MEDLLTLLGALAVGQAILLGIAAVPRLATAHPAVRVMAALLFAGAATLGAILLSHQVGGLPILWFAEVAGTLLIGPLFYAWVARMLEEVHRGRLRVHLPLPVAVAAYVAVGLLILGAGGPLPPQPHILGLLGFQWAYTVAALLLIARRWREPEAGGRRRLVALVIALLTLVHAASASRWLWPDSAELRDAVPAAGVLLLYVLGFVAVRQPRLLWLAEAPPDGRQPLETPELPDADATDTMGAPPERQRYGSSPLRAEAVQQLRERLLEHMATKRPYLSPELTLPELARQLGTLPTHLSRAVNESGENFPDLLARYRVEEAKRLLADPLHAHLTVDALGARAGFRSRSQFYEAFRRRTGATPSVYRKGTGADASEARPPG
jgi:AraC-like DNA-binding protein